MATLPILHVSSHAVSRFRERVRDVPEAEADAALRSPAIERAAKFGAPYVRLPTGQRVVLRGFDVITVLPKETEAWRLGTPK